MISSSTRNVLLSAPCTDPDPKKTDRTELSLEISKVTTTARPMTLAEITNVKVKISEIIDFLKKLFKDGKLIYDELKAAKIFDLLGPFGEILSGIWQFLPWSHDPIAEGLNELNKEVKQLAEKMTRGFNDMKVFISEVKFLEKVITPTSILTKHMMDCINHPGPEALENFRMAYSRHSPLMVMFTIVTNLEQKSTNPIRLAMDNATSQKATFSKWLTLIENVLGQLLILEAFATGLLKFESQFNCEQILKETQGVLQTMEDIKNEYGFDKYWDNFKIWLESFCKTVVYDYSWKMTVIQSQLSSYKTNDSFYIIAVCRGENFDRDWILHKCAGPDQFIEVTNEAEDVYYFVYRSLFANSASDAELEKIKQDVNSAQLGDEDAQRKLVVRQFDNSGFNALMKADVTWKILWANCPKCSWGPGWYTDNQPTNLFVGFR